MTSRIWIGMAIGGALIAGLTAWALHPTLDVQVERASVTDGPIVRHVVAVGTVEAVTLVEVGSQVSGTVQSLEADYDSVVHAGQVVAHLDPASYDALLQEARARLSQADADVRGFRTAVEDAHAKLARAEGLAAHQLVAQVDLEDARVTMDQANADLHAGEAAVIVAQAGVRQAEDNRDHTVIRSPIDGTVIDRDIDVGQTLTASVQTPVLFRIASDLSKVQVHVDIDESDIAGLATGEPATFTVESYGDAVFTGTVTQLRLQPVDQQTVAATPTPDPTGRSTASAVPTVVEYTAIIDVANPDERLRPGMTAEVVLAGLRRDRAVRIPNRALSFRPPAAVLSALGETEPPASTHDPVDTGGATAGAVWEYDGKRFTPIAVHIGLADDGWTELLSGAVGPGDALVTSAMLRPR
jgi:HlyD family secretion protein